MTKQTEFTIAFLGDIALNTQEIPKTGADSGIQCFEIASELQQADLRIANLECTLPGSSPKPHGPHLVTSEATLRILLELNIDIVSRANNHVADTGPDGLMKTSNWLHDHGILHLGAGPDLRAARQPLVVTTRIGKIGLLAYTDAWVHPIVATSTSAGANPFHLPDALNDIISLRNICELVIIMLHAGVQGYHYPEPRIVFAARSLVDAGADIVAMCHAHVLQGWETWHGKPILYGLGNFTAVPVFDCSGKLYRHFVGRELEGAVASINYQPDKGFSKKLTFTYFRNNTIEVDKRDLRIKQFRRWSTLFQLPFWQFLWKLLRIRNDVILRGWKYLTTAPNSHSPDLTYSLKRLTTMIQTSLFGQGDI